MLRTLDMTGMAAPVVKRLPVQNNTWVHQSRSRTVIIFVHGILSNSDGCWRNSRSQTYWPELVAHDPAFEDPAIFASGYTADFGAGLYDIRSAADAVLAHLRCPGPGTTPLDKDRLLFVCHSQGGIVVRQMLCSHFEEFKNKQVGVVLCGSPSWGSIYGTLVAPIAMLIRFQQGMALKWGGPTLKNLDRDFLDLLRERRIPNITGVCLAETRGRLFGLLPIPKVVAAASATRYFHSWHLIPKTTHATLVKPDSTSHLSHVHLRDFARTNRFLTRAALQTNIKALLETMDTVLNAYDPNKPLGIEQKTQALEKLFKNVRETLPLADREDRFAQIPLKELLTAAIDGKQDWAFYQFSRPEFEQLQNSLRHLSKTWKEQCLTN